MDFFTADTHFGHALTTRPFASTEEHDDHLIDQINATVKWNDRLYMLGDFAWRAADSYAKRIKCQNKHLIWGNHDKASYASCFKSVDDVCELKIDGIKIWLSHYPHAYWPASHHGSFHFYGHMHGEYEGKLSVAFPNRRSMDVCVDRAFQLLGAWRPFSFDELKAILGPRDGHHHPAWDVPGYKKYTKPEEAKDEQTEVASE